VDAPNGIRTVYTYDTRGRLALNARQTLAAFRHSLHLRHLRNLWMNILM
jgi:hypothetical protein